MVHQCAICCIPENRTGWDSGLGGRFAFMALILLLLPKLRHGWWRIRINLGNEQEQPTCNDRSANPTSILSVVCDDIPGFPPVSIGDRDLLICLLRLFSQHIGHSFM